MHELEVIVLDEPRTVTTSGELAEALALRVDGGNHFMVAAAGAAHPMLDVLVHGDYAALHYFATDGVTGDQAVGNVTGPPDEVEFPHSEAGDTIVLPGSVLVDADTADGCVVEFAETLRRPTLVDWLAL